MPSYKCKFEKGDVIRENGQFKVIMNKRVKNGTPQYKMKKGEGGRIKWQNAMDVDSRASLYE